MDRLFGSGASKAPKPTLDDSVRRIEDRVSKLDVQIEEKNAVLREHYRRANKPGMSASAKGLMRNRMTKLLEQRRALERQREQLQSQAWNMQQGQMAADSLRDTVAMVDTLKQTTRQLRKQTRQFDVDKIGRLQDEMADLLEMGNEIQETLAQSYDIPDGLDEADLDAELEMLGADVDLESEMAGAGAEGALPSFMQDEVPDFIDEPPNAAGKVKEVAG